MVPDTIERDVLIEAPIDLVWAIVTDPEHVSRWFSDRAELDLRPGGAALLTWHGHGAYRARVERVEPPHTFAFRWVRRVGEEPGAGNSTLVVFSLVAEGTRTRLRVVETGFSQLAWPEDEKMQYAGENSRGWTNELAELQAYAAEAVAGSARR